MGGWSLIVLLCIAAMGREAQAVTFQQQAARLQQIYAYLLDLRPGQPPDREAVGRFDLALEVIPMPEVNNRVGNKDEPVDPPPAIPRARARHVSAGGFLLGATYNPDIEVEGFSAPWLGFEAGYRLAAGPLRAGLRVATITAQVTGGITEPDAEDEFEVTNYSGDVSLGWAWPGLTAYGGAGRGRSESTLRVAADGAELESDTPYAYRFIGGKARFGGLALTLEQHRTEDFLDHLILAASWSW